MEGALLTVPCCGCRWRRARGGRRCVRWPAGSGRVQPELLKRMGLDSGSGAAGTDAAWESSVGWVGAGGLGASSDAREESKPALALLFHVPGLGRWALGARGLPGMLQSSGAFAGCKARPSRLSAPSPLPPVMCGPRVLVHVFSCCALARPSGQSACVLGLSGPAGEQGGACEATMCAVGGGLPKATC